MAFLKTDMKRFNKLLHIPLKNITRKLQDNVQSYSAEKLIHRKVVRITGESSSEFLQGLITNDMRKLENESASIYTMFLNNKGRVLYDTIIYRTYKKHSFLLDCDSDCVNELIKHLKLYKLRRKIDIIPVDSEYSVWAIYDVKLIDSIYNSDRPPDSVVTSKLNGESLIDERDILVSDPRQPVLGYRVLKCDQNIKNLPISDKYKICRYKLGIGEGVDELQIGQSFPLEINCDYLNGVSFDKGCYIGQELTARTYHTGVVRKRMMPLIFQAEPKDVPYNTSIDDPEVMRKTPIGKFKGYCENHGLGIMRTSETLGSKSLKLLDFDVKAFIPFWWPSLSVQQKDVVK